MTICLVLGMLEMVLGNKATLGRLLDETSQG